MFYLQTVWNIRDIQKHIFLVHQKKKIAYCNLCDFAYNGNGAPEKFAAHFAMDHPGREMNWTDETKRMSHKIVSPVLHTCYFDRNFNIVLSKCIVGWGHQFHVQYQDLKVSIPSTCCLSIIG